MNTLRQIVFKIIITHYIVERLIYFQLLYRRFYHYKTYENGNVLKYISQRYLSIDVVRERLVLHKTDKRT